MVNKVGPTVAVDFAVDAAYVQFSDAAVKNTVEFSDSIMVDFDEYRMVVGIEILGTKTTIPFSKLTEVAHVPATHVEALRSLMPSIQQSVLSSATDGVSHTNNALLPTS